MDYDPNVMMMITLTVMMATLVLLFIKRKTTMPPSKEDNKADGDDKTSTSIAPITNLPDGETYEVFLSFNGEDTRKHFTDHLYKRLVDVGVWVFRDNEALPLGEEIGPELDKAIKASKISIPIISPNYASSKWCLQELVHILECKKTAGQVVLPIFYRVDPSSVRHQTGTFETAFRSHKKKYGSNSEVLQKWRSALIEVASLKGLESSKIANGHEGELVEIVVTKVLNELREAPLDVTECLVGIEHHKKLILEMIEGKESRDAQAIVIHGMGGVGKTTLAKVIYNQLSTKFKYCTFLPDIREKLTEQKGRPEDLQKQLISGILGQQWSGQISHIDDGINIIKHRLKQKEVLILFDDVSDSDQLNALARNCSWFKSGSILLITTRNEDVLKTWEARSTYELKELDHSLSFLLFCKHAFRRDKCPSEEFHAIAEDIVSTTGGLPLAIEIMGSMLLGKRKVYWKGVLEKLQRIPHPNVQKKLRISYDALEHHQQQIFLDIACLSIQKNRIHAIYMWDDCGFFPEEGIEKLISLSLIKIDEEKQLTIHDQLRDLGRAIVREEDEIELGRRSRLWDKEEALKVIQRNQGTEKIQALILSLYNTPYDNKDSEGDPVFKSKQFKNSRNLRFLKLGNAKLVGDFKNLLLDLRWLRWVGSPFPSLPTNFRPTKLVVLDLSWSGITEQWEGWAQVELVKSLKVLNLEHCDSLKSTPDFSAFEKLEILTLRDCENMRRIHPSIRNLNKTLLTLDVRSCRVLEELPDEMGEMEELTQLLVDWTSITTIPVSKGYMTKLEILSANFCTHLQHLPDSIGSATKLVSLSLNDCHSLRMLPESIGNLKSLTTLKFGSFSNLVTRIDHGIANIGLLPELPSSLKELFLSGCQTLQALPSLSRCKMLSSLEIHWCPNLSELGEIGDAVTYCKLIACNALERLPNLSNAKHLKSLVVKRCKNLMEIQGFDCTECLRVLTIHDCPSLERLGDLSCLKMLTELELIDCEKLSYFDGIDKLSSLQTLKIIRCKPKTKSLDLSRHKNLRFLILEQFEILLEITMPQKLECLEKLEISCCNSLDELPDFSLFTNLRWLIVKGFEKLPKIKGLPVSLRALDISGWKSLVNLPDISRSCCLVGMLAEGCNKLTMIKELEGQKELKILNFSGCKSLEGLPDFSLHEKLVHLCLNGCEKLTEIKGLPNSLKSLDISGCHSLVNLPDLSGCCSLEVLLAGGCSKLTSIAGLSELCYLRTLDRSDCKSLEDLPDFSLHEKLERLCLNGCENLTEIKGMPISLKSLDISGCKSLVNLLDLSRSCSLEVLLAGGCSKLTRITGLSELCYLEILDISNCKSLDDLPDFSLFGKLDQLCLNGCENLTEIKGLPVTLRTLDISGCKLLVNLPDFSKFHSLERLLAEDCSKLEEFRGLECLQKFCMLAIRGCESLKRKPDLPNECISSDPLRNPGENITLNGKMTLRIRSEWDGFEEEKFSYAVRVDGGGYTFPWWFIYIEKASL